MWNTGAGAQPAAAPVAASAMAAGQASGGFMLSNHADAARVLPAPTNVVGKGLAAYRAAPIPIAARVVPRAPL